LSAACHDKLAVDVSVTNHFDAAIFRSKRNQRQRSGSNFSMSKLEGLPAELARHRILTTTETLEFVKISPAEWRKLRAAGKAPRPVMLGTRKQGWRIGDLIDWVSSRVQPAA
jgi:predicted DNA-binding transcriptional regulator AlpA